MTSIYSEQDDEAYSENRNHADDPFGGGGVDRVILPDPLRIETHVVDDFERKHERCS